MAIKSYLAHPHIGKKVELIQELSSMNFCEIILTENQEILILITDTRGKQEEKALRERLELISSLKKLSNVSGFFSDEKSK